jgi:hypothetical protein
LVFIWASDLGPMMSMMYPTRGKFMLPVSCVIAVIASAAYFATRLLIALSFTTLCALPDRAFMDVNWSMCILHF